MAKLLWGKVYFNNTLAGYVREESDGGSTFIYDADYLASASQQIAYSFPLQSEPFEYQISLPPFFDNLVAEGWLELAQARVLGKRQVSRFELLLAFGQDCAGAVQIIDSEPNNQYADILDLDDPKEVALLTSRASLSGVQPKLAVIERNGMYYPTTANELSTHIAKFPSNTHYDLVANEYLTTLAYKKLLPHLKSVELNFGKITGFDEEVLLIKRFDRFNGERIHFEEFNQLLDQSSNCKYIGSYKQLADFIYQNSSCLDAEVFNLYLQILAGILLGNTDMHLKNFAMLYTDQGLRLTPAYDQVAAMLYGYKNLALAVSGKDNMNLKKITKQDIYALGYEFSLNKQTIEMAIGILAGNFEKAISIVNNSNYGTEQLREKLTHLMEKVWNHSFV